RDGFLLAAQPEGLTHEDPRDVDAWRREVGFLRFTVGEVCDSQRVAETKALHELWVDVDFGPVPRTIAHERGCTRRILDLTPARQAVGPLIGRTESRIALFYIGELSVHIPAIGVEGPGAVRVGAAAGN